MNFVQPAKLGIVELNQLENQVASRISEMLINECVIATHYGAGFVQRLKETLEGVHAQGLDRGSATRGVMRGVVLARIGSRDDQLDAVSNTALVLIMLSNQHEDKIAETLRGIVQGAVRAAATTGLPEEKVIKAVRSGMARAVQCCPNLEFGNLQVLISDLRAVA
jgi:hypothetical protein